MADQDNYFSTNEQNNYNSNQNKDPFTTNNYNYEVRQHIFGLENLESVRDKQKMEDAVVSINNPESFGKTTEIELKYEDVDYFHKYEKAVLSGFLLSLASWAFYTGVNTEMVASWSQNLKIIDNKVSICLVSFFMIMICFAQHSSMHLMRAQSMSKIGSKQTIIISFLVCFISNLAFQVFYMNLVPYKLQILGFQLIFVGQNIIERSKEIQNSEKLNTLQDIYSSRAQFNHNGENEENTKRPKVPKLNQNINKLQRDTDPNRQQRTTDPNIKRTTKDELITDFWPTSSNMNNNFENNDINFRDSKSATYSAITQVQQPEREDNIMNKSNITDIQAQLGYEYTRTSSQIHQKTIHGKDNIVIPLHKVKNFMNPLVSKNIYDSNNQNSNTDRYGNEFDVPEFGFDGRHNLPKFSNRSKSSNESIDNKINEIRRSLVENLEKEHGYENRPADFYKSFSLNDEADEIKDHNNNKTETINFILKTASPEKITKKEYSNIDKITKSPNSFTNNTKKDHSVPLIYSNTITEFNQTANIRDNEISEMPCDPHFIDPNEVNFKKNEEPQVPDANNQEPSEIQDGSETPKLTILNRIEEEMSNLIGFQNERRDSGNNSRDESNNNSITKNHILKSLLTPENQSTISDFNCVLDNKRLVTSKIHGSEESSQNNNQDTSKKYQELQSNIKNMSKTILNDNQAQQQPSDDQRMQENLSRDPDYLKGIYLFYKIQVKITLIGTKSTLIMALLRISLS